MKKFIAKLLVVCTLAGCVAVPVSASGYFNASHKLKGTLTKKEELVFVNEQSGAAAQLIILSGYVRTYKSDGTQLASKTIPGNQMVRPGGNSVTYSTDSKMSVYRGRYSYSCKFDPLTTIYSDSGYDY